ncbi:hypothetical protein H6F94_31175 [Leptolyngbya sp. FACHB-261]|nr:hypothetical protein [Leptolyngbya sp. FACHB-261]
MEEILSKAESDNLLNFWLNETDHFLDHKLNSETDDHIKADRNQQAWLREYLGVSQEDYRNGEQPDSLYEPGSHKEQSNCSLSIQAQGKDQVIDLLPRGRDFDPTLAELIEHPCPECGKPLGGHRFSCFSFQKIKPQPRFR